MIALWHSNKSDHEPFFYQKEGDVSWQNGIDEITTIHTTKTYVHSVNLLGLEPDTNYFFQFDKKGPRYYFHTLPKQAEKPVRFVVGGDLFLDYNIFTTMNRLIAETDADFLVLGGDLAYAQSKKTMFKTDSAILNRWTHFFKLLKEAFIKSDGRVIPILPVVGNHDVTNDEKMGKEKAFFYEFFPQLQTSYRYLDIHSSACLFLMDTGHLQSISGSQTEWLEESLKKHENSPYKIPIYHIAAYPSCYGLNQHSADIIRKNWVPLFEKYQVPVAFEQHNHSYKKTFPIKGNKIDPTGVVYLGDGCWGVHSRESPGRWYLQDTRAINHYWFVTVSQNQCVLQSFDSNGKLIDEIHF